MKADVFSDSTIKASSLPSKDNLFTLVDTFVLHTPPASRTAPPSSGDKPPKGDTLTPFVLNPIEEVKLLLSLKTFLEELESVQLRFALFEALFGRSKETGKVDELRHHGSAHTGPWRSAPSPLSSLNQLSVL